MKKTFLWAVLITCIMLVAACKTVDSGNANREVSDATFKSIYDRYKTGLILNGAGTYTVKGGDTLANVSRAFYLDGFYYPIIMLASSDVVLDPDKIDPGMQLTIPDLRINLDNANARANIKAFLFEMADVEDNRGRGSTANGIRQHATSL